MSVVTQSIVGATEIMIGKPECKNTFNGKSVVQTIAIGLEDGGVFHVLIYLDPSCNGYEEALREAGVAA